ncbi:MAG TPA: hypothetical protein VIQ74_15025 [Gemmatimonadaceae bacterium]|jgi:hypothetical protein
MNFLVMLEEGSEKSPVLARVDSVPAQLSLAHRARDVVTLYGTPRAESLALAIAAALESRSAGNGSGTFRHLGVWPERGAIGDAAWRDDDTGELVTRDLEIPLEKLTALSQTVLTNSGGAIRRLVAGLAMPDWPEEAWRAINITLDPVAEHTRAAMARLDGFLENFRQADALSYEFEGD